ncbi:IS1 family transposase [Flavobacterium silvaticum]|uniref:IS1 family transposase n=1 Tax=Flavobacterium silvaticum TaxID=1852020 RepID=A0A972FK34_9FLAO|nr:IS1 family transposase [Flavobacterium silvaticum]NMH27436.1 IS1 family transposase [Flavobacterium silvaticum]
MEITCRFCNGKCIRNGFQKIGTQRYKCLGCGKRQQLHYKYPACAVSINQQIILLTKEGLGIRSTARVLNISATTVMKRIISIAQRIPRPTISKGQIYEVDEIRTFIRRKELIWIAYALDRKTKNVIGFSIGKRTNKTLNSIIKTLELSEAERIYTDRLRNYRFLVPRHLHFTERFGTNRIERKNLSLRTHLKRLNRKTICFSKSAMILKAILAIYFWS